MTARQEDQAHIPSWAVVGQRVVCIDGGDWMHRDSEEGAGGPHTGQVTTIGCVKVDVFGDVFLGFYEFPGNLYPAACFAPLDPREVEREMFMARQCGADVELAAGAEGARRLVAPLDRERA